MVSSLYEQLTMKAEGFLVSFKPYFRWLAPYTLTDEEQSNHIKAVLNLILDG